MRLLLVAIGLVSVQLMRAYAQPDVSPDEHRAVVLGDRVVRLVTSWGTTPEATHSRLVFEHQPESVLLDGVPAVGTLALGHGVVLVALATADANDSFVVRIVRREGETLVTGSPIAVARPGSTRGVPFVVAATATPDGFAVFFQETAANDPSAAHTYLARLDIDGTPRGAATEVPVPWSLGAAAWNGSGFHLALFYPGDQRGMRLSMVSLTEAGQPQQHPDWSSAAGFIADVHLVSQEGRLLALYRGGRGGDRFFESDVTVIRGWGSEPPRARDRGAVARGQIIAGAETSERSRVIAR